MPQTPWMKFYPADWRADPALRSCEPISRYVWLEMIGLMHEAEPYGHLLVNGAKLSDERLARLIDVPLKTLRGALRDLAAHGVYSQTDDGVIFSRRMVRDDLKARKLRENGEKGGNPGLKKQRVSPFLDNQRDNQGVKPHIPEARSQTPDSSTVDVELHPETKVESLPPSLRSGAPSQQGGGDDLFGAGKALAVVSGEGKPKQRPTRLPPDWTLPPDLRRWAIEAEGVPPAEVDRAAAKFRDYWTGKSGKDATKVDWPATWRNWIRNDRDRSRGRTQSGQRNDMDTSLVAVHGFLKG